MAAANPTPTKLIVFGATGLIGKHIIREIYNAKSSFEKIGFFTSESTARNKPSELKNWKEKGVEVIVGDVSSEEDVANACDGYDTIISALGRNAILAQIPLVKVAEASPTINFFYPSEYGTDIEYDASSASEKPHQLKLKVRKYIRENTKKLKVTYLVTGPYSDLFFGSSPHPHAGTFNVKAQKAVLLGTGEEKVSFTSEKDVGRLLVAALKTPTNERERILKVNSFTATPKEILVEFEKQTGARWEVSYTPMDDLKKGEQDAWEKQSPFGTMYTLRRIWTEGKTLYPKSDNNKIGFEDAETMEGQVSQAVKSQT